MEEFSKSAAVKLFNLNAYLHGQATIQLLCIGASRNFGANLAICRKNLRDQYERLN